jgi:PPOX class probable F420-dependent enzyme
MGRLVRRSGAIRRRRLRFDLMTIPETVREFLATGPFAHVVLRHPDGRLHVTLAWAGLDGDELIFSTFYDRHKMADIRRDPRVTLSFQAKEHAGEGLHPYLVIDGQARVIEGGALEVMDALAPAYIGPGAVFPNREVPSGATFRATVERIYGMGPWRAASKG